MSTPNSTIYVCTGVLLNKDYKHTIYFDSASAQQSYFAGKVSKTFSAYSYLRKTWDLNVAATMEQARSWTYLYFRNGTGKYYYYFINNVEYVNDGMVKLALELDVMQTYMFDYTLHACFVEREHSASDELYEHVMEEGLDVGEYEDITVTHVALGDLCIMVMTTMDINAPATVAKGRMFNGVYCPMNIYAVEAANVSALNDKLAFIDGAGKSEGVIAMWMYPKKLIKLESSEGWAEGNIAHKVAGITEYEITHHYNFSLGGDAYLPNNKKLFNYPYNYFYVTNNAGECAVYKPELFRNFKDSGKTTVGFTVTGAISPDCSVRIVPEYYRKPGANFEEGLTLGTFPTCAWNQDVYKLWLAQNQNQHALAAKTANLTVAGGIGTAIFSAVTGNVMGAVGGAGGVISGAMQIANQMAQKADKEIQPPNSKGAYSANINLTNGFQTFSMSARSLDSAHARAIDEYFSMFGYACRQVKVPNRKVRTNWTYTKTVDCHVSGNLCNEDLTKIQSIYDKGITFWVNGDEIGDYIDPVYGDPNVGGNSKPRLKYNKPL